eukprot:1571610-Alexandrium_andersonii.AAC.1
MTLLARAPPVQDLAALQPRLRPFLPQLQACEAAAARAALRQLEATVHTAADEYLAVLQPVVWLLPTEYADAYLRPSIAALG